MSNQGEVIAEKILTLINEHRDATESPYEGFYLVAHNESNCSEIIYRMSAYDIYVTEKLVMKSAKKAVDKTLEAA